jgi:hypothetical protein
MEPVGIFRPSGAEVQKKLGQVLISSIKGKVKKNTSPTAGYFLAFQPL